MKLTHKITFILFLLSTLTLTACQNTVAGFGKDMQKNGEEIQKSTKN